MSIEKIYASLPAFYSSVKNMKRISSLWRAIDTCFLTISNVARKTDYLSPFSSEDEFFADIIYVSLDEHSVVSEQRLISFEKASKEYLHDYLSPSEYVVGTVNEVVSITPHDRSIKGLFLYGCRLSDSSIRHKYSPEKIGIDISVYSEPTHIMRAIMKSMYSLMSVESFSGLLNIIADVPFAKFFGALSIADKYTVYYELVVNSNHKNFLELHELGNDYVFVSKDRKTVYVDNFPEEPLILVHKLNICERDGLYESIIVSEDYDLKGQGLLLNPYLTSDRDIIVNNVNVTADYFIKENAPLCHRLSVVSSEHSQSNKKTYNLTSVSGRSVTVSDSVTELHPGDIIDMSYLASFSIPFSSQGTSATIECQTNLSLETGMVLRDQNRTSYRIIDGWYDYDKEKYIVILDKVAPESGTLYFYKDMKFSASIESIGETIDLDSEVTLNGGTFCCGSVKVSRLNEVFSVIKQGTVSSDRETVTVSGSYKEGDIVSLYTNSTSISFSVKSYSSPLLTLNRKIPYTLGDEFMVRNDSAIDSVVDNIVLINSVIIGEIKDVSWPSNRHKLIENIKTIVPLVLDREAFIQYTL